MVKYSFLICIKKKKRTTFWFRIYDARATVAEVTTPKLNLSNFQRTRINVYSSERKINLHFNSWTDDGGGVLSNRICCAQVVPTCGSMATDHLFFFIYFGMQFTFLLFKWPFLRREASLKGTHWSEYEFICWFFMMLIKWKCTEISIFMNLILHQYIQMFA